MIDVYEIISSIEVEKKAQNISPSYALLPDITNEVNKRIKLEINQLVMDGKISWQETINSKGFSTINKE